MSVPVNYSAGTSSEYTEVLQISQIDAEMSNQWISQEGQLGKPDVEGEQSSDILMIKLNEYHTIWQEKYHTYLTLPTESTNEVTSAERNGAAYVLRCLKVWYDLPSDVLFVSMFFVDRFINQVVVKPKHMACLSVASFNLAIRQLRLNPIALDELATISQCGCTAGDLERMSGIISSKLSLNTEVEPKTSLACLRIYYFLFRNWAQQMGESFYGFFQENIKLPELETQLEILLCDIRTSLCPPSHLTYALICIHINIHIIKVFGNSSHALCAADEYAVYLRQFLKVPDSVAYGSFNIVFQILVHYNGHNKMPHKQRLIWKLSTRTLRVLRPTKKLTSYLPTIKEHTNSIDPGNSRTRMNSSSSEEDWPTSNVIPTFE